jgi:hypothetical protein
MHWAFDNGFFTFDKEFRVVVHDAVVGNDSLKVINGKKIFLPRDERAWPSEEALGWHRENVFGIFSKKTVSREENQSNNAISNKIPKEKRFTGTLDQFTSIGEI